MVIFHILKREIRTCDHVAGVIAADNNGSVFEVLLEGMELLKLV